MADDLGRARGERRRVFVGSGEGVGGHELNVGGIHGPVYGIDDLDTKMTAVAREASTRLVKDLTVALDKR